VVIKLGGSLANAEETAELAGRDRHRRAGKFVLVLRRAGADESRPRRKRECFDGRVAPGEHLVRDWNTYGGACSDASRIRPCGQHRSDSRSSERYQGPVWMPFEMVVADPSIAETGM